MTYFIINDLEEKTATKIINKHKRRSYSYIFLLPRGIRTAVFIKDNKTNEIYNITDYSRREHDERERQYI